MNSSERNLAIPDELPATESELIEYGRRCLRISKIATEEFGRACDMLMNQYAYSQAYCAGVMDCNQATISRSLALLRPARVRNAKVNAACINLDETDISDTGVIEGELVEALEEDADLDDFAGEDDAEGNPAPKTSGPVAAQKIAQIITNEWYTPEKYIQAAKMVLGEIDLDPASSELANQTVQAARFHHADDSGLDHPWAGRVWLNPPYGNLGPAFITRLIEEYQRGAVKEAIVLVNSNCVPTRWFRPLWDYVLCFHYGRINFNAGTEERTGSTHGSVFVYLGENPDVFSQVFAEFGVIVQRRQP